MEKEFFLEAPKLCYKHLGDKLKANFYKVADNSYCMVIIEQDEKLRKCKYPKIGVGADKYPRYVKYNDVLFLRGVETERDYNPVALDYDSFNLVKDKLKKLENYNKKASITINCKLNELDHIETFEDCNIVIENKKDIEKLKEFFKKITDKLEQEIEG